MSLFSWLTPARKQRPDAHPNLMPDSALSRVDSTRPVHAAEHQHGRAEAANRKHERMVRREQLYAVVREAMVRASVLSASYKFKVLSLDAHGRQFLVMIDLARAAASEINGLSEIEAMIAQSAKARHDILVTAVYWRTNDHVAVGDPMHAGTKRSGAASRPAPLQAEAHEPPSPRRSRPAPLEASSRPAPLGASSRPAPLYAADPHPEPTSHPAELRAGGVEPLHPDEVAAFRKALDVGIRGEQALAAAHAAKAPAPHSYTLLTGFEDTELANDDVATPGEHLSATQYGLLR
jgi:hypothetical protein